MTGPVEQEPRRIVLLKPGDTLMIGNVGAFSPEDLAAAGDALAAIRDKLGLAQILIFAEDIDIDSYRGDLAQAIAAELETRRYPA